MNTPLGCFCFARKAVTEYMNDDSFVKIMSTLGLNYDPAIQSTLKLKNTYQALTSSYSLRNLLGREGINRFFPRLGNTA